MVCEKIRDIMSLKSPISFMENEDDTKALDIKAKKIKAQEIAKVWYRITDKPMPYNIYAFILEKKDFTTLHDLTANSPQNQALCIAEHGRLVSAEETSAFITRRFIDGKLFNLIIIKNTIEENLGDVMVDDGMVTGLHGLIWSRITSGVSTEKVIF